MMDDPALWGAVTPVIAFVGCAVSYYAFSGTDDLPHPRPLRGDAENEPWGKPYNITGKRYRFPGDRVQRSLRAPEDSTAQFAVVNDERNNDNE